MSPRRLICLIGLPAILALAGPAAAHAQLVNKLKNAAQQAAEDEASQQVAGITRGVVRCVFDDLDCIEEAEESGEEVVLTDSEGEVITDADGNPVTDPEVAKVETEKPGQGVWANYDFVPGDQVLFAEDLTTDRVGDFPRRLEFVKGNMEVVEWQGRRFLRVTAASTFNVELPQELPERFTIEFDLNIGAAHLGQKLFTSVPAANLNDYPGSWFQFNANPGVTGNGPESTTQTHRLRDELTPVRIHVDGQYAKVYLNEQRVANVPNASFPRSSVLQFQMLGQADLPTYIGAIRIAGGGLDLYDVLSAEGRVATRGILFDLDSDRIRPESTPTLDEIGAMLVEHPDLRISIEGHTDSSGEEEYNQELSEKRALAVRAYLIEVYEIDDSRLKSEGFGESLPVADNDTPEGRQQNRRVELVRLD